MLDLAIINGMSRADFVDHLGPVFENAPWVSDGAWNSRPFSDVAALHLAMLSVVHGRDLAGKIAFLRAHPDLAGQEAKQGTMTQESVEEQGTAGLDRLSPAEAARIDALNGAYRNRHGFPFVVCVRHFTKLGIFAEFTDRLGRDTDTELEEALRQVGFISGYRLKALLERPSDRVIETAA